MSHVACHLSRVMCHMSHVTSHRYFFLTNWWSLSVEGLLSTGPTPSSLGLYDYLKSYKTYLLKYSLNKLCFRVFRQMYSNDHFWDISIGYFDQCRFWNWLQDLPQPRPHCQPCFLPLLGGWRRQPQSFPLVPVLHTSLHLSLCHFIAGLQDCEVLEKQVKCWC